MFACAGSLVLAGGVWPMVSMDFQLVSKNLTETRSENYAPHMRVVAK